MLGNKNITLEVDSYYSPNGANCTCFCTPQAVLNTILDLTSLDIYVIFGETHNGGTQTYR